MIDQVGNALAQVLRAELKDILPNPGQIGVYLPYDRGDVVLGLYLYSVRNSVEINVPALTATARNVLSLPPRFLDLYYLMTVYGTAELPYRAIEEHRILERGMQAFERCPVLKESQLGFSLGGWVDELRVQFADLDVQQMSHAWEGKDAPYRLSVAYKVCPVQLSAPFGRISSRVDALQTGVASLEDK